MMRWPAFVACVLLADHQLLAGEEASSDKSTSTTATEEETPDYKNWVNLIMGGVAINGDAAQFKQEHRISGDVFGGIEDMHYEHAIGKDGLFAIDGRAIFDNDDYNVKLELSKPGLGYIRAGYTEFRSWYDGNGGFFPINGQFFDPPNQEMTLDRGEAWIELGLRIKDWPEITLHYSHQFRDGMKDSTIWGDTTLTGLAVNPSRKIAPAFRDIDEKRDIFSADIEKTFGNTDVTLGMRYEHDSLDNSLNLWRGAGQLPPVVLAPGAQRFITQKDNSDTDMFSGHVATETRWGEKFWVTTAYSYTSSSSDLSGSRVIGPGYDVMFGTPTPTLQSNDHQILNLAGTSWTNEHVANMNLLWTPLKQFTILSAFRYTHESTASGSIFLDFNTAANTAPFTPTNPQGGFHITPATIHSADTMNDDDDFAETLEMRYDGFKNWLLYARADWEEEDGNVQEHEVVGPTDQGSLNKDANLFSQKYTVGANWYPLAYLNFSSQYYHTRDEYDNTFLSDLATPPTPGGERNQRLLARDLDTDDVNFRVTWRPRIPAKLGTIAIVARYDYVRTTVDSQFAISPAVVGAPPTGTILNSVESAILTDHRITGTVSWNPTARLYFQGNVSYVLNKTDTPADYNLIPNTSVTVFDFKNDYWTAGGSVGFFLNAKTDLRADYTYYRADNYDNNALVAVPYGAGAREHTISATVSREITKNVRALVKYTYFDYRDETSGGFNNYTAHAVYSGLQFRF